MRGKIGNLRKVVDGDTFFLKTGANNSIKVRLAFIDAPELNQPLVMMLKHS